jgi:DNA adenine methylase
MTCALAKGGAVLASDACVPLVNMWRAARAGWVPPTELSKEAWQAAKQLPDTDPLKAFAGFACSFRGLWFSGYAGGYVGPVSRHGAVAASEVIVRDAPAPFDVICIDFLAQQPRQLGWLIYCDPPYAGTSGYIATAAFDSAAFERRVCEWSEFGPVLVSECRLKGSCDREALSSGPFMSSLNFYASLGLHTQRAGKCWR